MLLLIDNYDSFTHNIARYFRQLQQTVVVKRHDEITLAEIDELQPQRIVISPGPCTPDQAGISLATITTFANAIPILGICLGHQSIAQAFGGRIVRAKQVMHGKTSTIYHQGQGMFTDVSNPFTATRYHSLVVAPDSVPDCFTVTAWTQTATGEQDCIMGLQHNTLPLFGVQFHPESILTTAGHTMLQRFLAITA